MLLVITTVMMAFSMQFSLIELINLDEHITQNILQNPISEEEEEHLNEVKDAYYVQSIHQLTCADGNEIARIYFRTNHSHYTNTFIKTPNQPPEHNL